MEAFFDLLAGVLAYFYQLVPNYAVAICMLTIVVMIIVTPLTLKGTRSMMVMQKLQPEMRKIQQKYKDDRQKQNEELLKFYKEHNISPIGGCLPLLVQAPVFIVLYQVLHGMTRRESSLGFGVGWSSGQLGLGTPATEAPTVARPFDPAYLNPETELYQSLHGSTTMESVGMDLSQSASAALGEGIIHSIPYMLLIVIVAITGFVQQRQIQGRVPNSQINPQQQMIMKILPVFLPIISFGLPSGLVLYFAVSNLFRIGQQAFISRSIYGITRADRRAEREKKRAEGKGLMARVTAPFRGGSGSGTAGSKGSGKGSAKGSTKGGNGKSGATKGGAAKSKAPERVSSGSKSPKGNNSGGRGAGSAAQPTLQPRARRQRKR